MIDLKKYEVWFVTGSQHLYGDDTLVKVAAHGGREFGYICARMRKERAVVVGHWQDESVQQRLGTWARAACAWADAQGAKIARFGDNMRDVAVTDGDKVEAQRRFGYSVNGYGVGDLADFVNQASDAAVDALLREYEGSYRLAPNVKGSVSLKEAAWIHAGGSHHTVFTMAPPVQAFEDFTEMAGVEFLLIDESTSLREFKRELRLNEAYFATAKGI